MNFLSKLFSKSQPSSASKPSQSSPESLYVTEITADFIKVTHLSRPNEQIAWKDIESIKLVNTDEGPFLPDVLMVLTGNGTGCSIPQGSDGWDRVYAIVSKYRNFNFDNVIKSASCTGNQVFDI